MCDMLAALFVYELGNWAEEQMSCIVACSLDRAQRTTSHDIETAVLRGFLLSLVRYLFCDRVVSNRRNNVVDRISTSLRCTAEPQDAFDRLFICDLCASHKSSNIEHPQLIAQP